MSWEFQRNLYSYSLEEIADQKGEQVWTGELQVEKELNQEITTAFPIMEAVPELQSGVYLLTARPGDVAGNDYGERTTQWFIVSDLGLTAYSGTDGIHAFVNSLATTAPLTASRSDCSRATTRCSPPRRPTPTARSASRRASRAAKAGCRRR